MSWDIHREGECADGNKEHVSAGEWACVFKFGIGCKSMARRSLAPLVKATIILVNVLNA